MLSLRSLASLCLTALAAIGTIGGGMIYKFTDNEAGGGSVMVDASSSGRTSSTSTTAHLLTSVTAEGKLTSDLYTEDTKNYKCVLSYPGSQGTAQTTETDDDCKIYSIDNSDDKHISIQKMASVEAKNEIKKQEEITKAATKDKSKNAAFYQVVLSKEVLDKFKSSNYSGIEVKLVSKTSADSSSSSEQGIVLKSLFRFDDAKLQGQARSVVVQITNNDHKCADEGQNFTLGDNSDYHFFNLSGDGASITSVSQLNHTHHSGLRMGKNNQLKCSDLKKDKFYILRSPSDHVFDLSSIAGQQQVELSCQGCESKVQATVVRFLAWRPKIGPKRQAQPQR